MVSLRKCQKKGRPRLVKALIDQGTPELQHKRQLLLKSLRPGNTLHEVGHNTAIFDGCCLHRLFYQGVLNEQQKQTGLAVRKLYHICLRSQGIKNRLSCSSAQWGGLKGKKPDNFENAWFERKWSIVQKTIESFGDNLYYSQLILKIILNDSLQENSYGININNNSFLQSLQRSLDNLSWVTNVFGASLLSSHKDISNKRSH